MSLLQGVRVVDLTAVISGPLCSYQLAMLGAHVIKIEVPGIGDIARRLGADPEMNAKLMGVSFWALNAGKKSITLNLKHERGKAILLELVKDADVVVENYRPGTMKSLGLDYPVLREVNPRIVYCAISGFGQDGPLARRPSYDQIIQGLCGIMSLTGNETSGPTRSGYQLCDTMASVVAAFAISSALYHAQKTGKGQMIDVSMLDATLATMPAWPISGLLNAGKAPVRLGNDNPASSPSGTFRTGEGLLNIVCNDNRQFHDLCDVIGTPALRTDPRFVERPLRVVNRNELKVLLEEALQAKSAREWDALLNEANVPAGLILTLPEILAHPHVRHRELIKRFEKVPGIERDIAVTRAAFRLSDDQPDVDSPPPYLGQHTDEVLKSIGYTDGDIAQLRDQGVV